MKSIQSIIYGFFFMTLWVAPGLTSAQTFFFDRNWNQLFKSSERKNAKYYRKVEQVNGIYQQSDFYVDKKRTPAAVKFFKDDYLSLPVGKHTTYFRNGRIKFVGNYISGEKNGLWQYFWPNGRVREEGEFLNDLRHGVWKRHHKNGDIWAEESFENGVPHGKHIEYWNEDQLRVSANFNQGRLDGELVSYFQDGTLRRKEVYEAGKPIEKNCYTPTGQDTTYYPYFRTPLFPGCEDMAAERPFPSVRACAMEKMYAFIQQNLVYPDAARIFGKQGTVLLSFTVKEDGSLKDPLLLEDISEDIAHECLRLFYRFPDWIPGKKDGEVSDVYFEIPLVFQLN